MATPSPTYVEIVRSRSSIPSTYAGWTAPTRTSASPQARTAASLLSACASRSMASRSSSSASVRAPWSAIDHAAVLDSVDDLGDRGVAEEHLERDDRLPRHDSACSLGETLVHHHHVGVVGDRVHRGVLDRDILLLQLPTQGAGQHDAAAHSCVTGDHQLADVTALDARHGSGPQRLVAVRDRL